MIQSVKIHEIPFSTIELIFPKWSNPIIALVVTEEQISTYV